MRSPASFNGKTPDNPWGLASHLVSNRSAETRQYLLDFAFTPDVLNSNLKLLRIDPAKLGVLILSHGHLGGLLGFLQVHRDATRRDLRLYIGGEDGFCHRVQQQDGSFALTACPTGMCMFSR